MTILKSVVPLFSLLLIANSAIAVDFTVDTTTDAVDVSLGDGTCATAAAECSLRAAIQETNALAGADMIQLPAGTFLLTIVGEDQTAAAGDLDITDDLTVTGATRYTSVIDGNNIDRIFDIVGDDTDVNISKLTVQNGTVSSFGGAGIINTDDGTVTLSDCAVLNNLADGFGGGVLNDRSGSLTIDNCLIQGNFAKHFGGGVSNDFDGTMTITNSTISGNYADAFAGGVNNNSSGSMTISNSTISGNAAESNGGGVNNNSSGTLTITDTIVSNNSAGLDGGGDGGGIINNSSGTMTLEDVEVSGNFSADDTGGIENNSSGSITGTRVSIFNNSSVLAGGGITNGSTGTFTLTDSTIAYNASEGGAGGVESSGAGTITLTHVTIQGNTSESVAGGINETAGAVIIENTIIAHNFIAGTPAEDNCDGVLTANGINLESADTCSLGGANLVDTNPLLGELKNHGGFTASLKPLKGSPVIDAAADAFCTDFDQNELTRPIDGDDDETASCDIGAVEYQSLNPAFKTLIKKTRKAVKRLKGDLAFARRLAIQTAANNLKDFFDDNGGELEKMVPADRLGVLSKRARKKAIKVSKASAGNLANRKRKALRALKLLNKAVL